MKRFIGKFRVILKHSAIFSVENIMVNLIRQRAHPHFLCVVLARPDRLDY